MPNLATMFVAVGLALLHLEAGRLRKLPALLHQRWLSLAAGASVAYIFVHVLPELSEHQRTVAEIDHPVIRFFELHVYLIALIGFGLFYGLEHLACRCTDRPESTENSAFFWLHIGSFTVYNALIGYLLVNREDVGVMSLALFAIAFGLHFFVIDHGLREHHQKLYHDLGRWFLALAILVGWGIGTVWHLHPAMLAVLFAFLGGSAILNVMKEELPSRRESCWWAFALGAGIYALILIVALQDAGNHE